MNHLHHTITIQNRRYSDCLYSYHQLHHYNDINEAFINAWSLIPYCRTPSNTSNENKKQCQGQLLAFSDLRRSNVTVNDLFIWQASIDILDDYQDYLDSSSLSDGQSGGAFCNCTVSDRFGPSCEYHLENIHSQPFNEIIVNYFANKTEETSDICYQGPIAQRCSNLKCLHWHQICDGYNDCVMGEDERLCLAIEANICRKDEYRCKNGFCIPLIFAFDLVYDCFDRSDESQVDQTYADQPRCSVNPSVACEDLTCSYPMRMCGNRECHSLNQHQPFSARCLNRETDDSWYKIVTSDWSLDKDCWQSLICLMGINEHIPSREQFARRCTSFCSLPILKKRADNLLEPIIFNSFDCRWRIEKSCLGQLFIFPSQNPDIPFPPDVQFWNERTELYFYTAGIPTMICYNGTWCDGTYGNTTLTCRRFDQFGFTVTKELTYWEFRHQIQRFFFLRCHPPPSDEFSQPDVDQQQIYTCMKSNHSISRYRLQDSISDCPTGDDESFDFRTICTFNMTDRMPCPTGCIPRRDVQVQRFGDACYVSEFYLIGQCMSPIEEHAFGCEFLRSGSVREDALESADVFRFWQMCDGHATYPNADDERNCIHWKQTCNRRDEKCNGRWDCIDGSDEVQCNNNDPYNCPKDHRYCFTTTTLTCLPLHRVGDGHMDCLGATDERDNFCLLRYPDQSTQRFRCANSQSCVGVEQVCDGQVDCPHGDDELPCPWRKNLVGTNGCPNGTFACHGDSQCRFHGRDRCTITVPNKNQCKRNELRWFCDLIDCPPIYKPISLSEFNQFPLYERHQQYFEINTKHSPNVLTNLSITRNIARAVPRGDCHRGLAVGDYLCLCPTNYYGDFCQYENDRVSIHLGFDFGELPRDIDDKPIFFRLIATLLNEYNKSIDREEFVLHPRISNYRHIFNLVNADPKNFQLFEAVRFDTYRITMDSVRFHSTRTLLMPFRFLPVNRLALVIDLSNALEHKNDENFTPIDGSICSLGRFGRRCKFYFNPCMENRPCKNGGTCYPFDIRMARAQFICLCPAFYFGNICQWSSARALIEISNSVRKKIDLSTPIDSIPLMVIYLAKIYSRIPKLIIKAHLIYTNVEFGSVLSLIFYHHTILSDFIFVELFFNAHQREYYLAGLHKRPVSFERIVILPSYQCPHINNILIWSMFNLTETSDYLIRIKLYHRACYTVGLHCFYDEFYMCVCDNEGRMECFLFDHSQGNCSSTSWYCLNEGVCRRNSLTMTETPFACACPSCFYGELCQFTTTQYSMSLDALDIRSGLFVGICLTILVGTVANLFSFVTFLRPKLLEVGCSFYLITLTVIGQIGLLAFLAKFMFLFWNWTKNRALCIGLEFGLTVLPTTFDWFTVCVAVERTAIVIKGTRFDKRGSRRKAKRLIIVVILFNIIANLYEPFYRRLLDDPSRTDHAWCVLDFPQNVLWLGSFRKVMNIVHIIVPFGVNLLCTLILLVRITKSKYLLIDAIITSKSESYSSLLREQMSRYKDLLISPCVLLVLGLPRLVFTFAFACVQHPWQQHVYIASYFISILPMALSLFIFVFPSVTYKKELMQTRLIQLIKSRPCQQTMK